MNKLIALGFVGLLLLAGCQKAEPGRDSSISQPRLLSTAPHESGAQRRFIAVAHKLLIEAPEDSLPKAWEAAAALCRAARCEILSSSISNKTADSPPSATLALRIAPEDLPKLFDQLGKSGNVLEHVTESEDKTGAVIDVEAQLKNMTEFRNRLRTMLGTRTGPLKDIIEVERELSRVQAELDSLAGRRQALANQTEKVSVRIEFRAPRSIAGRSFTGPIAQAARSAAFVLSESIALLVTFVVAIVPWLLLLVPFFWMCAKLVRRLFRKAAA